MLLNSSVPNIMAFVVRTSWFFCKPCPWFRGLEGSHDGIRISRSDVSGGGASRIMLTSFGNHLPCLLCMEWHVLFYQMNVLLHMYRTLRGEDSGMDFPRDPQLKDLISCSKGHWGILKRCCQPLIGLRSSSGSWKKEISDGRRSIDIIVERKRTLSVAAIERGR